MNRRHKDFQSSALPTELPSRPLKITGRIIKDSTLTRKQEAAAAWVPRASLWSGLTDRIWTSRPVVRELSKKSVFVLKLIFPRIFSYLCSPDRPYMRPYSRHRRTPAVPGDFAGRRPTGHTQYATRNMQHAAPSPTNPHPSPGRKNRVDSFKLMHQSIRIR